MVVDDTPENLKLLSSLLKQNGYKVYAMPRGDLALEAALRNPPDLILLDINMPGLNGYETCRLLKQDPILKSIPVIFISALNQTIDKVDAFHSGGVDYITKPFVFEEIQVRITTHLQLRRMQIALEDHNRLLEKRVAEQVRQITDSQMETIFALAKLAELRDKETGRHLERVRLFCRALARHLQGNASCREPIDDRFIDAIYNASPLHDIGKVGIADDVLRKPGKLTAEEYEQMKRHTIIGARTLTLVQHRFPNNAFISMGADIARHHHERWDGTGYPDGLSGCRIPLAARIMSLADVYDALRAVRRYKNALSHAETIRIIIESRSTQFDPVLVDAFQDIHSQFEEITISLMDSGEYGLDTSRTG
ncbi:response regulator [bacterium]|nr:response regulator [candidate division CSSED10-310 bacterium]